MSLFVVVVPQVRCRRLTSAHFLTFRFPGCVVAGRLAYADPNLKVMLIEGESHIESLKFVVTEAHSYAKVEQIIGTLQLRLGVLQILL